MYLSFSIFEGLAGCGTHRLPELLQILDFLMDHAINFSAGHCCSCICSVGGCPPVSSLVFVLESSLCIRWLVIFEWLEILEERGLEAEARSACLAYLGKAYFYEADLHHTSGCCEDPGCVPTAGDDSFWDISEHIKRDDFNTQIQSLFERDYHDLKREAMILQRRLWSKDCTRSRNVWKLTTRLKEDMNNRRNKAMLPILDILKV